MGGYAVVHYWGGNDGNGNVGELLLQDGGGDGVTNKKGEEANLLLLRRRLSSNDDTPVMWNGKSFILFHCFEW